MPSGHGQKRAPFFWGWLSVKGHPYPKTKLEKSAESTGQQRGGQEVESHSMYPRTLPACPPRRPGAPNALSAGECTDQWVSMGPRGTPFVVL